MRTSFRFGSLLLCGLAWSCSDGEPSTQPADAEPALATPSDASFSTRDSEAICYAIRAEDYSHDCQVDSDCETAFVGNLCDLCTCANASINKRDLARYTADLTDRQRTNAPHVCGCPCQALPSCQAGVCTFHLCGQ